MGEQRFKGTRMGSFWGEYLYERVVHQNHFLRRLDRVIMGTRRYGKRYRRRHNTRQGKRSATRLNASMVRPRSITGCGGVAMWDGCAAPCRHI